MNPRGQKFLGRKGGHNPFSSPSLYDS